MWVGVYRKVYFCVREELCVLYFSCPLLHIISRVGRHLVSVGSMTVRSEVRANTREVGDVGRVYFCL